MLNSRYHRTRSATWAGAALALTLLSSLPVTSPQPTAARHLRARAQAVPAPNDQTYRVMNLISDIPGLAPLYDPLLSNPWALSLSGPMRWVVNSGSSTAQLINAPRNAPATLNPSPQTIDIPGGQPTGLALNSSSSDFLFAPTPSATPAAAELIFYSLTGHITAWNAASGNSAHVVASMPGHVWTGLTADSSSGSRRLYAADFANNHIDVFDNTFAPTTVTGGFADPTVPPDYHVYNIGNSNGLGSFYVTYAKVGPDGRKQNGPGLGYVRKFDADGVRDPNFAIDNGALDAPWGMARVGASVFPGNALLVGNSSDFGTINAYDPSTGAFLDTLKDTSGRSVVISGLRELQPAHGGPGALLHYLFFTAGIGAEQHGFFGSIHPTHETPAPVPHVRFASDSFTVGEGEGYVEVTMTCSDGCPTSVNYSTFDEAGPGQASQKSDYEMAVGTLTFSPGETSKTFRVPVVDDNFVEGDEVIHLALSIPTTAAGIDGTGSPAFASLTILDNDSSPPVLNPVDETQFFVRQHYLDFLNREPDPQGFAFWTNEVERCGADSRCREVKRVNVSAAFFLSIEFQRTGYLAYLANRAAFGASAPGSPTPVFYGQFMREVQGLQRSLVFGQPGFDAQLEANKQAYFAAFVARPEFVAAYPTSLTPAQFVDALYAKAGVTPTAAERAAAVEEFSTSGTPEATKAAQARVLRRVAENTTFAQVEFSRAFVLMQYFGYLRRDPDAAPDTSFEGYNFWLAKLEQFGGDYRAAEMVKAFISSVEYRRRFGQ